MNIQLNTIEERELLEKMEVVEVEAKLIEMTEAQSNFIKTLKDSDPDLTNSQINRIIKYDSVTLANLNDDGSNKYFIGDGLNTGNAVALPISLEANSY